jgi:uncharacterized protein (TIGR00106 family)
MALVATGKHCKSGDNSKWRGTEMVIAEVSVIPMGTKTPSASEYVARAVRVLAQQKNVKYQLMAMGTLLEGDLDAVLEATKRMHESVFGKDVQRVVTSISIDDRRDKQLTMDYKVQSVAKKLG